MSANLTRAEVEGRLCQLQAEVVRVLLGFDEPTDCFCFNREMGGYPTETFRNSGRALVYIEEAVRAALAQDKERKATWLAVFKAKCRERLKEVIEEVG